jgi:hypothetical protein
MIKFGGKDSKRHFTVVIGGKEHGLYVSSTPSSAAKKAVTKLCTANKSKKVEFHIREITQGSKKKTYGPYTGYIQKLKEPIELKGRAIRYKPVAKLSCKVSSKKEGMIGGAPKSTASAPKKDNRGLYNTNTNNNNIIGNPAAGPAPVINSNNNNNDFRKNEQVAFILLKTPDDRFENTDDYDEKIQELKQIDNDIFNISIDISSRNNGLGGYPVMTSIFITFNNFSRAKNKENFEEHLIVLIEVLKYFKKAADTKLYEDIEVRLFEPNEEYFTPEYNEFLKFLAYKINPIAPTVNKNRYLRHVPAPKLPNNFPQGSAPPWNNTNLRHVPALKLPNYFPQASAPPWNNT